MFNAKKFMDEAKKQKTVYFSAENGIGLVTDARICVVGEVATLEKIPEFSELPLLDGKCFIYDYDAKHRLWGLRESREPFKLDKMIGECRSLAPASRTGVYAKLEKGFVEYVRSETDLIAVNDTYFDIFVNAEWHGGKFNYPIYAKENGLEYIVMPLNYERSELKQKVEKYFGVKTETVKSTVADLRTKDLENKLHVQEDMIAEKDARIKELELQLAGMQETQEAKKAYEIRAGIRKGALEVYFDEKPETAVLDALKELSFRWNWNKKCWYGYAEEAKVLAAIA